jgi:hypothetical protein
MRVIRPEATTANIRALRDAWQLWLSQAQALEALGDGFATAAFHAAFAGEVAWLAATHLREWSRDPAHYILVVGVDPGGEVLGINTAYWVEDEQSWYMAVGATRPIDQPGYPSSDQVRGIGLEIVGAMVAVMNETVCAPVTLEPLDDAARAFWSRRGFHDDAGAEMRMSCPESRELALRLAHSERDDPTRGDFAAFTDPKLLRLFKLHGFRH